MTVLNRNQGIFLIIFIGIFLICAILNSSYAWALEPKISESQVIFPQTGKVISYTQRKILYSDPEEANEKGQPVFTTEKAVNVKKWGRLLLITEGHYYEDGTISIAFYDYSGEMLKTTDAIFGELSMHIMENTNRVFLCQQSIHYCVNTSYIFDKNGELINKIEHSDRAAKCGVSKDHKIIWTVHNSMKIPDKTEPKRSFLKLYPYSTLKVYDKDGELLYSVGVDKREDVNIQHDNKEYFITVEPDFPG